jgi:hypothetical protein
MSNGKVISGLERVRKDVAQEVRTGGHVVRLKQRRRGLAARGLSLIKGTCLRQISLW